MYNKIPKKVPLIFNGIGRLFYLFLCMVFLSAGILLFLRLSGFRPLIVLSGSMEPAVHTGSLIFVNTKKKDALPGDIITFDISAREGSEFLVTHRVVREEGGLIVTKGDANESEDPTRLSRGNIVGTYVFQIPMAGYLTAFIRQRLRYILSSHSGSSRFGEGDVHG